MLISKKINGAHFLNDPRLRLWPAGALFEMYHIFVVIITIIDNHNKT